MQRTFIAVNKAIVQGKLVVPCNPVSAILPFLVVVAVCSTILSDTANAEGHRFSLFFCILWDLLALSLDHIENWWNILHVLAKHFLRRKCTVHCAHFSTTERVYALDGTVGANAVGIPRSPLLRGN